MPDFVTMADERFAPWAELLLPSLKTFHPEATVWLFDLGDTPSPTLARLAEAHGRVRLVHYPAREWQWPDWIDETDLHFYWPGFALKDRLKMLSRRLRHRLLGQRKDSWVLDLDRFVAARRHGGKVFVQKPHIVRRALEECEELVYIDVDALLLGRLDDALPGGCHAGLTLVAQKDLKIGRDPGCGNPEPYPHFAVNAGVLFFRRAPETLGFLDAWEEEIGRVRHTLFDQTAVANLLYRHHPDAFRQDSAVFTLPTPRGEARVATLPCARFNHYTIRHDQTALPDDVRIAHFVGSLKQSQHWPTMERLARNEIRRRHPADEENPT